jgi:hypothetical protein
MLGATALAAAAAGLSWRFQQTARKLAIVLAGSGYFLSMAAAVSDFQLTQHRRAEAHGVSEALAALPERSLVISFPEWGAARLPGNGSILATRDSETKRTDPELIHAALDAGYRVFIDSHEFDPSRSVPPGIEASLTGYTYPRGRFIELKRWSGARPDGAAARP